MIYQHQWRTGFLATTSIGISLATLYTLIAPTAGNRPVSSFEFPDHIPLNSWQQVDSKSRINSLFSPPKPAPKSQEFLQSAHNYHYSQNGSDLQVEVRYLVGTRGDVNSYLQEYTEIPPEAIESQKIEQLKEVGYYTLLTSGDRAYLSSCISPRSLSSATQKQFSENRDSNDFQPQVWLNWLQGTASIRDRRCLWTHLSTPIPKSNPEIAYRILETAWSDWYRWWLPRFPSL
jgi:cyanosortase A-associated protein